LSLYRTYTPHPPLSDFVEAFWLYDGYPLRHAKERRLPDGAMELVINLREDRFRVYDRQDHEQFQSFHGCLIVGAHSECSIIDTACQASIMGVHFKPGGAFPFLTLPAGELQNLQVSLDTLWGEAANDLRDQLLDAETLETRFHILEQSLLARVTRPPMRHPAVAFALKEFQGASALPNPRSISDVTERIGLSSRRFIQVFCEEVGLTPKQFCRVQRFQEALGLIERREQIEWADIALTCGYFDQAHFNHDFRAFSGLNPGTYLTHRSEHHNHVLLSD
jgi:AraC-like DNA-binding protein